MIPRRDKLLNFVFCFWSSVPFLAIATVYADAWHTASALGHLPLLGTDLSSYYNSSDVFSWLSNWLALALLASPFVWSFLFALNRNIARRADGRVHAFVFTLGWIVVFLLYRFDPGGIISWWID